MSAQKITRWSLLVLILGAVAACGRAGPLEPPPSAAKAQPQGEEEAPVEDKPFILDGLLR